MNKKAIKHDIKGIQCDSSSCDYKDLEVEFDPEKWLNAPCPKCGANLFTDEAYEQLKNLQKAMNLVNGLVEDSGINIEDEEYTYLEPTRDEGGMINGFKILNNEEKGE